MGVNVQKHNAHHHKTEYRVFGGSNTKAVCGVEFKTGSRVPAYSI